MGRGESERRGEAGEEGPRIWNCRTLRLSIRAPYSHDMPTAVSSLNVGVYGAFRKPGKTAQVNRHNFTKSSQNIDERGSVVNQD